MNDIIKKTGLDQKNLAGKIKKIEKEKNITPETAALLICKEYEVDASSYYQEVENKIFKENKE